MVPTNCDSNDAGNTMRSRYDATLRHHKADIITSPQIPSSCFYFRYDKRSPALSMMAFSRLRIESEGLKQLHSELEKVTVLPEQTPRREPLWPRFKHRHKSMTE